MPVLFPVFLRYALGDPDQVVMSGTHFSAQTQECIQPVFLIQRLEIIETTDVIVIDEYLRYRMALGLDDHNVPDLRVVLYRHLCVRNALLFQKPACTDAVRTESGAIYYNSWHDTLDFRRVWNRYRVPRDGQVRINRWRNYFLTQFSKFDVSFASPSS